LQLAKKRAMIDKIKEIIEEAEGFKAQTKEEVEAFRVKYLGKKGVLNDFLAEFKNVANDQKKRIWSSCKYVKNNC
jgi:phenylalanyl-tRNA synthetase alpha chain